MVPSMPSRNGLTIIEAESTRTIDAFLVDTDAVMPLRNPKFNPAKHDLSQEGKAKLKGTAGKKAAGKKKNAGKKKTNANS